MQHAVTQRKERLTGVADGAKGLPHPVGDRSRVAARARDLSRLVRKLANTALGASLALACCPFFDCVTELFESRSDEESQVNFEI